MRPAVSFVAFGIAALSLCACADWTASQSNESETPEATQAAERQPVESRIDPGRVTRIELQDFFVRQQSGEVLIYDVRPAFFHLAGHIPGSVNWPKSAYENQLARREVEIRNARKSGRPVVLYCADAACPDARVMAERLAARGHDICVLEGGWELWKQAGLDN